MRNVLAGLVMLLLLGSTLAAQAQPEPLALLGRSQAEALSLPLREADRRWLWNKRTLRLGTSVPDYPPFDITANAKDYQGITADMAALIAELLNLRVDVVRYPSRQQAIAALRNGEIDVLGSANIYDVRDADLVLSQAYADDLPTLVTRIGESQDSNADLAGKRLAMAYHYLPTDTVQRVYPDASLQVYPSTISALGAVAFGQADVFLGNLLGANYLVNNSYLNNVELANFASLEPGSFGFAVRQADSTLLRLINMALSGIDADQRGLIMRRWGADALGMRGQLKLQFSEAEQQWLQAHPKVRVLFIEGFMPFTFLDDAGQFRGIAADVLNTISFRTGLTFDVKASASLADASDKVARGEADMLAALTPSQAREKEFNFSRAYFTNAFVLISRDQPQAPNTLEDLSGKRLAVIQGNALDSYLSLNYPHITQVASKDALDAMAMVARGEVDAAVNSLISARYMISRQYRGKLRITATVGNIPGHMAFAVSPKEKELHSILDKAMLSIPPDELDVLTNRWRREVVVADNYWETYRSVIVQGGTVVAILLLAAFLWISLLRRQIRRREQAERALTDQIEFMRVLVDGTPNPIYVRDRDARLLLCNASYLNVFGVNQEAVIGKRVTEAPLTTSEEGEAYEALYFQVMHSGQPLVRDNRLTLANGEVLTIFHWMLPYRRGDGEMAGIIAGWIDISERQRLLQSADDASRAKTQFLATMSHEIRTPLNAVIGMLELALKKAEQNILDRLAIEVASGAAKHLLELIGDILDIARIESGRMTLTPERANLHTLVQSVVRVFEGQARDKHIDLSVELDEQADCDVLIDPLRFKQVLSNLLSNAIKFTDKGGVAISLTVHTPVQAQDMTLEIRVIDSGVGIPKDDIQGLFAPFVQASNNHQHARSGSGLGLVISRSLCEKMGASLTLDSLLGVGTEAKITLTLKRLAPLATQAALTHLPETGLVQRVLVVDDYPANRMVLSQQLAFLGHQVVEAVDGKQGLALWSKHHFDVVITDCHMPVMNGYEMARLIRAKERQQRIPACLLLGFTANAMADELARCQAAGMDDCLFKPTSLAELARRLGAVQGFESTPDVQVEQVLAMFDLSTLEQLAVGNHEKVLSLLGELIQSLHDDVQELDLLLANGDSRGLANLAHRVRGGARIIKAHHLISCCQALEQSAMQDAAADLQVCAAPLREAIAHLVEALENHH